MSLYFALDKTGYNLTQPSILPTDHSKHVPVYKIISQPMHPKSRNPQVEVIAEEQQQIDLIQGQKSSRSLDVNLHKKVVKYVMMNTQQRLMEKQQVNSIYEGQSSHDPHMEKDSSVQDTNASMINTIPRNFKLTSVDVSKGKMMSNSDDFNDHSQLELELNKERILRNNLQKSYNSLLQRVKLESAFFGQEVQESKDIKQCLTPSSRITAKYGQQTVDEGKDQRKVAVPLNKLRRSCCQSKQKKGHLEEECSESEQAQNDFMQHLQNHREFKAKLCEQLLLCEDRIESIESQLTKRQKQLQKAVQQIIILQKENDLLKLTKTCYNQHMVICHQQKINNKSPMNIRQHFHYIFTILILFFVIVLLTKKQN